MYVYRGTCMHTCLFVIWSCFVCLFSEFEGSSSTVRRLGSTTGEGSSWFTLRRRERSHTPTRSVARKHQEKPRRHHWAVTLPNTLEHLMVTFSFQHSVQILLRACIRRVMDLFVCLFVYFYAIFCVVRVLDFPKQCFDLFTLLISSFAFLFFIFLHFSIFQRSLAFMLNHSMPGIPNYGTLFFNILRIHYSVRYSV